MLTDAAQYIAPGATMIAAMMTAANLGSRITGWGFVVFTVGAIGWVIVGLATGQHNLMLSNGFLLIVDLVGVWRWLGLRARYDKGAEAAAQDSAVRTRLFQLSRVEGRPVTSPDGAPIGRAVDAMLSCDDGRIVYLVVSEGGLAGAGERLHALGWRDLEVEEEAIVSHVDANALAGRTPLDPTHWPAGLRAADPPRNGALFTLYCIDEVSMEEECECGIEHIEGFGVA
ncbi:sporulation protein YlmC with PRC-barrel domain, partial [Sphingomonas vulcanisoli]